MPPGPQMGNECGKQLAKLCRDGVATYQQAPDRAIDRTCSHAGPQHGWQQFFNRLQPSGGFLTELDQPGQVGRAHGGLLQRDGVEPAHGVEEVAV